MTARIVVVSCALSLLIVTGCARPESPSYDPWAVDPVAAAGPPQAPAFEQALFATYVALARAERVEGDWADTRLFLDRARALLRGEASLPLALDARPLAEQWRKPVAAARARLMAARQGGARSLAPRALARAQGAFECWYQEAEENRLPAQRDDLQGCRSDFAAAMAAVDEGLGSDAVVLLPDERGHVGGVLMRTAGAEGPVVLDRPGAAAAVSAPDAAPRALSFRADDTRTLFGDALDARPVPPRRFSLPAFETGAVRLPDGSAAVIDAIMQDARRRPAYDLVITGYADTVGPAVANRRLGLRRARAVRARLAQAGLEPAQTVVQTRGEDALAVPTDDAVAEPRNRRVVVTVR